MKLESETNGIFPRSISAGQYSERCGQALCVTAGNQQDAQDFGGGTGAAALYPQSAWPCSDRLRQCTFTACAAAAGRISEHCEYEHLGFTIQKCGDYLRT